MRTIVGTLAAIFAAPPLHAAEPWKPSVAILRVDKEPGLEREARAVEDELVALVSAKPALKVKDPTLVAGTLEAYGWGDCADDCARKIANVVDADAAVQTTLKRDRGELTAEVRVVLRSSGPAGGAIAYGSTISDLIRSLDGKFPAVLSRAVEKIGPAQSRVVSEIRKKRQIDPEVESPASIRHRIVQNVNLAVLRVTPLPSQPPSEEVRKWIAGLSVTMITAVKDVLPDVRVMETRDVYVILQAQGRDPSKCDDELCKYEIGQLVGAEFLVEANLSQQGSQARVDVRITDVAKKKQLTSGTVTGRDQASLESALAVEVRKGAALLDDEIERRVDAVYEPLVIASAENKAKRSFRRKVGWGTVAVAAAGALFVGYGAYSGLSLNDKVQRGGYDTPTELTEAVNEGQQFNKVVKVVAIGAGVAAVTGVLLILLNQDPKAAPEGQPTASFGIAPGMLVAQGRF